MSIVRNIDFQEGGENEKESVCVCARAPSSFWGCNNSKANCDNVDGG